ncbi:hypothetical protein DYY67_1155 [Candidatus Nitrosotalea sp. TS]|nr:hypothetical protein [Candidatus Nitrosotalea sp. TS]
MNFGLCPSCNLHRELDSYYSKRYGKTVEICKDCYKSKHL